MKETLLMSACCLMVVGSWMVGAGTMALDDKPQPWATVSDRILILKCAFTGDPPRSWLIVEAHNAGEFKDRGFDPSLTRIVADYKPIARKLGENKWEITFTSEAAEGLP